jgi:FAD dependent oxidoreductase TIGR03364
VKIYFNTAVQAIALPTLVAGEQHWFAQAVVVAAGDDYQTLFPQTVSSLGLKRCKLQMLRTVPQPGKWRLGPSLAFGLSFRHYESFRVCDSLPALAARVAQETPELDKWGIHVMVSATADGALTLGDSHEYGLSVDVFDRPEINRLILDFARQHVQVSAWEIAQLWHGVYAKHAHEPYLRYSPASNAYGIIVTSGAGMTLSFGLAEQTMKLLGVSP